VLLFLRILPTIHTPPSVWSKSFQKQLNKDSKLKGSSGSPTSTTFPPETFHPLPPFTPPAFHSKEACPLVIPLLPETFYSAPPAPSFAANILVAIYDAPSFELLSRAHGPQFASRSRPALQLSRSCDDCSISPPQRGDCSLSSPILSYFQHEATSTNLLSQSGRNSVDRVVDLPLQSTTTADVGMFRSLNQAGFQVLF
jgi:hypothetical protein